MQLDAQTLVNALKAEAAEAVARCAEWRARAMQAEAALAKRDEGAD